MRSPTIFLLLLSAALAAFGQSDNKPETTFEILLQTVIGSPNGRTDVSPALEPSVKKLKNTFGFSGFQLDATYVQRASKMFEYKGMVPVQSGPPAIAEWTIRNFRRSDGERGTVFVEGFRYGVRAPIVIDQAKPDGTKPGVVYEMIGISSTGFKLIEGEPALVGSLKGERPGEMIFIFLTATPVP